MGKDLCILLMLGAFLLFPASSEAIESKTRVVVNKYLLSINGYHSPFATITLSTGNSKTIATAISDSKGYFYISKIPINNMVSAICIKAVDSKKTGEAKGCISIKTPIIQNPNFNDVFLPPSIGVSEKRILLGQNAKVYGLTMPNATVNISINSKISTIEADLNGYYEKSFEEKNLGIYHLIAFAKIGSKSSLSPFSGATIEVVGSSSMQNFLGRNNLSTKSLIQNFENTFKTNPLSLLPLSFIIALVLVVGGSKLYIFISSKRRKKYRF